MRVFRNLISTGMDAALRTGNALTDNELTRQARDYVAKQALKGRDEVTKILAAELKHFLDKLDLRRDLASALEDLTLEVKAQVHVLRRPKTVKAKKKR